MSSSSCVSVEPRVRLLHQVLEAGYSALESLCTWRHASMKASIAASRAASADSNVPALTRRPYKALEDACVNGSSSMVEAALHCLHELLSNSFIAISSGEREATDVVVLEEVLTLVYGATTATKNDNSKLHGLKLVLVAATAPSRSMQLGIDSFLLCLKTCFEVEARSDYQAHRTAATAALTQMLTMTMLRLENASDRVGVMPDDAGGDAARRSRTHRSRRAQSPTDDAESREPETFARNVIQGLADSVVDQENEELLAAQEEAQNEMAHLQKVFLVALRILLRMSMKPAASYGDRPDQRMQTLARDMLILVLRNAGMAFRHSPPFIDAVKEYVEGPYITHCLSPSPKDFRLALSVLAAISLAFSKPLSHSIGLAINHLSTLVLEGSVRDEKHVLALLELLAFIAARPNVLGDLFVPFKSTDLQLRVFCNVIRMLQTIVVTSVDLNLGTRTPARLVQTVRILGLIASTLSKWLELIEETSVIKKVTSSSPLEDTPVHHVVPVKDNGSGVGLHLIEQDDTMVSFRSGISIDVPPPSDVSLPASEASLSPKHALSPSGGNTSYPFKSNATPPNLTRSPSLRFVNFSEAEAGLRLVLEEGWAPALAALSLAAEHTVNHPDAWRRCLDSYSSFITLSLRLGVSVARQAFIRALVNSARLNVPSTSAAAELFTLNRSQLYPIEMLLELAHHQGHLLESSWDAVLLILSQLEHVRSGVVDMLMERVEAVYSSCVHLPRESLHWFVRGLCSVSRQELFQRQPPWMYALPRLSRLILLSLHRDPAVLSRLWKCASDHLVEACSHPAHEVADFVINAIGQILEMVFSEEAPATLALLQHEFVDTLVSIMGSQHDPHAWFRIVEEAAELVKKHVTTIKSGWSGFIVIFTLGAREDNDETVMNIIRSVRFVCDMHLDRMESHMSDFVTVIDMLAHSPHAKYRHAAMQCSALVAQHCLAVVTDSSRAVAAVLSPNSSSAQTRSELAKQSESVVHVRSSMRTILNACTMEFELDPTLIDSLSSLLESHASEFGTEVWTAIRDSILQPLPSLPPLAVDEDVARSQSAKAHAKDVFELFQRAFNTMIDIFIMLYPRNSEKLQDVLQLLDDLMSLPQNEPSRFGFECFRTLLESLSGCLTESDRGAILAQFALYVDRSCPKIRHDHDDKAKAEANTEAAKPLLTLRCETMFELILEVVPELAADASPDQLHPIVAALRHMANTSRAAPAQAEAAEPDQAPAFSVEVSVTKALLAIATVLLDTDNDAFGADILLKEFDSCVKQYMEATAGDRENGPEAASLAIDTESQRRKAEALSLVLDAVHDTSSVTFWTRFSSHALTMIPLVEAEHVEVRRRLAKLLQLLFTAGSSQRKVTREASVLQATVALEVAADTAEPSA